MTFTGKVVASKYNLFTMYVLDRLAVTREMNHRLSHASECVFEDMYSYIHVA